MKEDFDGLSGGRGWGGASERSSQDFVRSRGSRLIMFVRLSDTTREPVPHGAKGYNALDYRMIR